MVLSFLSITVSLFLTLVKRILGVVKRITYTIEIVIETFVGISHSQRYAHRVGNIYD